MTRASCALRSAVALSLTVCAHELLVSADSHEDPHDPVTRGFHTVSLMSEDGMLDGMPYVIKGWADTRDMDRERWLDEASTTLLHDVKSSRKSMSRPWSSSKPLAHVHPNEDFVWIDQTTLGAFVHPADHGWRYQRYVADVDKEEAFRGWPELQLWAKRLRELGPRLLPNTTKQRKTKGFLGSQFAGTAIHYGTSRTRSNPAALPLEIAEISPGLPR